MVIRKAHSACQLIKLLIYSKRKNSNNILNSTSYLFFDKKYTTFTCIYRSFQTFCSKVLNKFIAPDHQYTSWPHVKDACSCHTTLTIHPHRYQWLYLGEMRHFGLGSCQGKSIHSGGI